MSFIKEKIFINKLKEAREYVEPTVADKIQKIIDLLIDENHSNKESRQKFVDLLYQLVELENDSNDRRTSVRKFFKYVSGAISDYEKDIEDDSDMVVEESEDKVVGLQSKREGKPVSKKELLEKINELKERTGKYLKEEEKARYSDYNYIYNEDAKKEGGIELKKQMDSPKSGIVNIIDKGKRGETIIYAKPYQIGTKDDKDIYYDPSNGEIFSLYRDPGSNRTARHLIKKISKGLNFIQLKKEI